MTRRWLLAALVGGAVVASSCGGSGSSDTETVPAGADPAPAAEPAVEPADGVTATTGRIVTDPMDGPPIAVDDDAAPAAPAPQPLVETREAVLVLDGQTTVQGATFDADSLAGRDVLLWFWAPW